ncbi:hypothetical protein P3T76_014623 [Phytophthora citrophthora]|uniref:Uncharacterized protein n=1 Tax=Phytophthora citrophthora TaxID=4793 RepID=A0AAD9LB16_9STRA|nr:hypothetical protein P3T76_014623 [Phytophthora citrophthora]
MGGEAKFDPGEAGARFFCVDRDLDCVKHECEVPLDLGEAKGLLLVSPSKSLSIVRYHCLQKSLLHADTCTRSLLSSGRKVLGSLTSNKGGSFVKFMMQLKRGNEVLSGLAHQTLYEPISDHYGRDVDEMSTRRRITPARRRLSRVRKDVLAHRRRQLYS